jgi:hypothetical protein
MRPYLTHLATAFGLSVVVVALAFLMLGGNRF